MRRTDLDRAGISTTLKLKVVPCASRTEIVGWLGDKLKVRVSAPPEKGKANAAVEAVVAQALNLPTSSVRIIAGISSSQKIIEILGLPRDAVFNALG